MPPAPAPLPARPMLALPLLTPERSLRLASLPAGEDPDTLVARQGREAFQAVLDAARPLAEALFDLLREPGGETTPEQRAALRARLEEAAGRIRHRGLAAEYRSALLDRFFADRRGPARRTPLRPAALPPRPPDPAAWAAASGRSLLVGILLRHPVLLADVEEAFERLELPPALAQLRREMLAWSVNAPALDSERSDVPPDLGWSGGGSRAGAGGVCHGASGLRRARRVAGRGRGGLVAFLRTDAS